MGGYLGPDVAKQRDMQNRIAFTADEGQVKFGLVTYTPGYCNVYHNGIKLPNDGSAFSAIDGKYVTLTSAAIKGDTVEVEGTFTTSPFNVYNKAQVDALVGNYYGVSTGSGDAMVATLNPMPVAWSDGMEIKLRAVGANSVAAPTLTINGLVGTKVIKVSGNQALTAGTFVAGQEVTLRYNLAGDRLELISGVVGYGATPDAADNSKRFATTAWLYNAMATVMTYFGFACSLAGNGYLKLPSILGGVIFQWGGVAPTTGGTVVTFPLAFPNRSNGYYTVPAGNINVWVTGSATPKTTFNVFCSASTGGTLWFAVGF